MTLKGPLCSSGDLFQTQNFGVYNVNGEIKQTHKYTDKQAFLSGKKKHVPRTLFVAARCQGPPNINKVKQYEIVKIICLFNIFQHKC